MWKYKRVIALAIAILFLLVLFALKNDSGDKNLKNNEVGLNYAGEATLEELVAKDTDLDGIADWEEALQGTDLNQKDSYEDMAKNSSDEEPISMNRTEQFSKELFSTVAALSQAGNIDRNIVTGLGESLGEKLAVPNPGKTFSLYQIKTTKENTSTAMQTYNAAVGAVLFNKYPAVINIIPALQGSLSDDSEINVEKLSSNLSPLIAQINGIVEGLLKVSVPSELASKHLSLVNTFQRVGENLTDIKLVDEDTVVAINAVLEVVDNIYKVDAALQELAGAINSRLSP